MNTKLIYWIYTILLLPACMFYSFKGSLPAHIHSISLAPVVNESTEFSAAEILNDELNKLMVAENVLDIVTLANWVLFSECTDNPQPPVCCCAGDMGTDFSWNVLDIVALANCVLTGSCGS